MSESTASETIEQLQAEIRRLKQTLVDMSQIRLPEPDGRDLTHDAFHYAPYSIAILYISKDGSVPRALSNPASQRMLGLMPSNPHKQGTEFDEEVPEFDVATLAEIEGRIRACLEAQKSLEFDERLVVGGREVWTHAIFTPLPPDHEGNMRVMINSFDTTEQKKREQEELGAREFIIEQQMATLSELSTPLLNISDNVVVLPLIGAVDSRRAQQIMEALLIGISRSGAQYAILDITGVPVVDTQVANVLIQATQAVRLLGSRVILTGIRPEVAQTLVGLGIDLTGIITRSTLQAGIQFSLREHTATAS